MPYLASHRGRVLACLLSSVSRQVLSIQSRAILRERVIESYHREIEKKTSSIQVGGQRIRRELISHQDLAFSLSW